MRIAQKYSHVWNHESPFLWRRVPVNCEEKEESNLRNHEEDKKSSQEGDDKDESNFGNQEVDGLSLQEGDEGQDRNETLNSSSQMRLSIDINSDDDNSDYETQGKESHYNTTSRILSSTPSRKLARSIEDDDMDDIQISPMMKRKLLDCAQDDKADRETIELTEEASSKAIELTSRRSKESSDEEATSKAVELTSRRSEESSDEEATSKAVELTSRRSEESSDEDDTLLDDLNKTPQIKRKLLESARDDKANRETVKQTGEVTSKRAKLTPRKSKESVDVYEFRGTPTTEKATSRLRNRPTHIDNQKSKAKKKHQDNVIPKKTLPPSPKRACILPKVIKFPRMVKTGDIVAIRRPVGHEEPAPWLGLITSCTGVNIRYEWLSKDKNIWKAGQAGWDRDTIHSIIGKVIHIKPENISKALEQGFRALYS